MSLNTLVNQRGLIDNICTTQHILQDKSNQSSNHRSHQNIDAGISAPQPEQLVPPERFPHLGQILGPWPGLLRYLFLVRPSAVSTTPSGTSVAGTAMSELPMNEFQLALVQTLLCSWWDYNRF
jgi:hypothetical protein